MSFVLENDIFNYEISGEAPYLNEDYELGKLKLGLPRIKVGQFEWKMTPKQALILGGATAGALVPGLAPALTTVASKIKDLKIDKDKKEEREKPIAQTATTQAESTTQTTKAPSQPKINPFVIIAIIFLVGLVLFFIFKKRRKR